MNKILALSRKNRTHTLIVLLIAMATSAISQASVPLATALTEGQPIVVSLTTSAPMLAGAFRVVNNGPGHQMDAHIDCGIVSYTNDDDQGTLQVRYFDFATDTDHLVPGYGADSLSDISGGRIVFIQWALSGRRLAIFDIASQTTGGIPPVYSPAIGGNLIAFDDRNSLFPLNASEVGAYDISTGTSSRLSNDSLYDRNAAVSPTGNAVVWEKCQSIDSGCDIYAAIQSEPAVFTTIALTGAEGEEGAPSTNGQMAVYTSTRDGETDIYLKPLAGGSETQLSIPGHQRHPNIAGNLISFESLVQADNGTQYDIFVYDLSTVTLYRVTNTPVNETLSDISVCDGVGRIVYSAPSSDMDLFAFTFRLPGSAENQINDLVELIQSLNLASGTANSLISKLQEAVAALDVSDTATACTYLTAFINESQAQSGKKLTSDQAAQLINSATEIKDGLGCE